MDLASLCVCALLAVGADSSAGPPPPMPPLHLAGEPERPAFIGTPSQDRTRLRPVGKYRTAAPHRRATSVPAELLSRLTKNPSANLKALVNALVSGVGDPFEKTRILHDWVALNIRYDWPAFESNRIPDQSFAAVLTRRTAVCDGYARLFETLCRTANLECATVGGYARGAGLSIDKPEDSRKDNHAWNAVKLEGAWYLLDVTWDSPDPEESKAGREAFGTTYFLVQPEWMIFTHLPADPAWQLLPAPIDAPHFDKLPWLDVDFLELSGAPIESIAFSNPVEQELDFFVTHPSDVSVIALVQEHPDASTTIDTADEQWAGLRREETGTRITAGAPSAGRFQVLVMLRGKTGRTGEARIWMTTQLPADHGYASLSSEFVALTHAPPAAQQLSNRVVKEFRFTFPHPAGIQVTANLEPVDGAEAGGPAFAGRAGQQWVRLEPERERTTVTATFPRAGTYRLIVWANKGGTHVPSIFHLLVEQGSEHGYLSIDPTVLALTGAPLEGTTLSNHLPRTFSLRFRLPKGVTVEAGWQRGPQHGKSVVSTAGGLTTVSFTFPASGAYLVTFWARKVGGFVPAQPAFVTVD